MQNTSRVMRLILPLSLDYQHKISCRMNNLRSEICYFAVDFEKSHQEQNFRRSAFFFFNIYVVFNLLAILLFDFNKIKKL
jgi:hypothetical protein